MSLVALEWLSSYRVNGLLRVHFIWWHWRVRLALGGGGPSEAPINQQQHHIVDKLST